MPSETTSAMATDETASEVPSVDGGSRAAGGDSDAPPPVPPVPAVRDTPWSPQLQHAPVPGEANTSRGASAKDENAILHQLVKPSIAQILQNAPWTFAKTNVLKESCRFFLDACDVATAPTSGITVDNQKLTEYALGALMDAARFGKTTHAILNPAFLSLSALVKSGLVRGEPAAVASDTGTGTTTAKGTAKGTQLETGTRNDSCSALIECLVSCSLCGVSVTDASPANTETLSLLLEALVQCTVSDNFSLTGISLTKTLEVFCRLAVTAGDAEVRQTAKAATTSLINTVFKRAGFELVSRSSVRTPGGGDTRGDGDDTRGGDSNKHVSHESNPESNHHELTVLTAAQNDAARVVTLLCERVSNPENATHNECESSQDPFHVLTTAFTPAAASFVKSAAIEARTRAVALDVLRLLLDGPGSKVWLRVLAPDLRKPLRNALVAAVDTEGGYASPDVGWGVKTERSRPSAPLVATPDPATAATASLARAAFASLTLNARSHYKTEIGRLYPKMVLRPLEGGSSSVSRTNHTSKLAALRVVRTFASEPQVLVDIFVNYDCDVCGENLYERTVGALANTMAPGAGEQQKFRDGAVQCVLALVRSLRAWHARGDVGVDDGDGVINSSSETAANAVTDSATATSAGARDKTESDRFAYMKHRKASLESATHGFNTRPNVVTLARVMEFSVTDDNASISTGESSATASNRTSIDTAHSSFPERAALFLRQRGGGDFGKNGTGSKTKARTLDPGSVGALLGSDDVDSLAVMRAFAETFAFSGSTFDAALRLFVSPFRVPGEAQKIDRLMETFARRFCACNPGTFTHTDQAYVLAFAVVMLNTDAHNPKTDAAMKMTESAFVEMVMSGMVVEGKAGGGDTSTESDETSKETSKEPSTETSTETSKQAAAASSPPYASDESLRALYRRVVAVEIKMSPGHDELGGGDNDHDSDEDEKAFGSVEVVSVARANTLRAASAETEHVLRKTKALFGGDDDARGGGKQNSKFHAASEPGLSRPMLDTAGAPLTRAVSRAFLNAEDAAHAALPLEGARATLLLASQLNLPNLRDALCDFLALAPRVGGDAKGTGPHGVEATKTLLQLACETRSLGDENWPLVLEVVSRLDALKEAVFEFDKNNGRADATRPEPVAPDRGRLVDDLFARYLTTGDDGHDVGANTGGLGDTDTGASRVSAPPPPLDLTLRIQAIRAPLRFAAGSFHSAAVSVFVAKGTQLSLTPAELALGRWLSTADGARHLERVFTMETHGRFDDVSAAGFVAALAGVAVADVWAPAGTAAGGPRSDTHATINTDVNDGYFDPATLAQIHAMPFATPFPRPFAVDKLASVVVSAMERQRTSVRFDIWTQRVAPVFAGMAGHPDFSIVKAGATGLFLTASAFAERAAHTNSCAAATAAFAPFADAHRWAVLGEKRSQVAAMGKTSSQSGQFFEHSSKASLLARRLAAASAGLCVSSFGKSFFPKSFDVDAGADVDATHTKRSVVTATELAGLRSGLLVLTTFAGDTSDTVARCALTETVVAAIADAAKQVVTSAVAEGRSVNSRRVEDTRSTAGRSANDQEKSTEDEVLFGTHAVSAFAAFATRRNAKEKESFGERNAVCVAHHALRSLAVAVAEAARDAECATPTEKDATFSESATNLELLTCQSSLATETSVPGERTWRSCLDALASSACLDGGTGSEFKSKQQNENDACSNFSTHALDAAFAVLTHESANAFSQKSWDFVLEKIANASIDVDGRREKTANAKTTWETTTRDAVEWSSKRAPVCLVNAVKLLRARGDDSDSVTGGGSNGHVIRVKVLGSAKPFATHHLPNLVTVAVECGDVGLLRVVGRAVVEIARALCLTFEADESEGDLRVAKEGGDEFRGTENGRCAVEDKALLLKARRETWTRLVRVLDRAVTCGSAAAVDTEPKSSKKSTANQSDNQSENSVGPRTAGAVACSVACHACSAILFDSPFHATPPEIRDALLDVLARTHAFAAATNAGAIADAACFDFLNRDKENGSGSGAATLRADSLVRLETEVGCLLLSSLEWETGCGGGTAGTGVTSGKAGSVTVGMGVTSDPDMGVRDPGMGIQSEGTVSQNRKFRVADRLGAAACAALEAAVAISKPPGFSEGTRISAGMGNQSESNETQSTSTGGKENTPPAVAMNWFAESALRRDALSSREVLVTSALRALCSLRSIDLAVYKKRASRATASAAALVKVDTEPTCVAVGDFFAQIGLCGTWGLVGGSAGRRLEGSGVATTSEDVTDRPGNSSSVTDTQSSENEPRIVPRGDFADEGRGANTGTADVGVVETDEKADREAVEKEAASREAAARETAEAAAREAAENEAAVREGAEKEDAEAAAKEAAEKATAEAGAREAAEAAARRAANAAEREAAEKEAAAREAAESEATESGMREAKSAALGFDPDAIPEIRELKAVYDVGAIVHALIAEAVDSVVLSGETGTSSGADEKPAAEVATEDGD